MFLVLHLTGPLDLILKARDTVIHLLQSSGFIMNQKKSVMTPTTKIEFLGTIIHSTTMELSLLLEK